GFPGKDGWRPQERLSVADAVRAYTVGAARASGEGLTKGSLAPGRLADFIVLEQDLFQVSPQDIPGDRHHHAKQ
ncbi:MAG: amidohydrolase family protein, partial [Myxococcales bacterium]